MTFPGFPGAVSILDTTLRDGDQSPGCAFSPEEKLTLARILDDVGVDVIEAGFPTSSPVDFRACELIAREGLRARVAAMTRSRPEDIEKTARVFASSTAPEKSMLHLSLPVSERHIQAKLGKEPAEIVRLTEECTRIAAGLAEFVEVGAEDATRADREFLVDFCAASIAAGASLVNIADTVGVANPAGFGELIRFLIGRVPEFRDGSAALSVHCHNDLGLATANSLAAIEAGAAQIETTIAGIGERAGNAGLEEIVANLLYRSQEGTRCQDVFTAPLKADGNLSRLSELSRAVSAMRSTDYGRGRPIVGGSARPHASGMHQSGILIDPALYNPVAVALSGLGAMPAAKERVVLSRHSGRAGLAFAIRQLTGETPSESVVASILKELKDDARRGPIMGTTELLDLLADNAYVRDRPYRCYALQESADDGRYTLSARIGRSVDSAVQATGRGDSWASAAVAATRGLCPWPIRILSVSASAYAVSDGECANRFRVTVAAKAGNAEPRSYAIERLGNGLSRVFLDCVLDVINAELTLAPRPS